MPETTFAADVALLKAHTEVVELSSGDAAVAVAPAYQGRVMTSTLAGGEGASFGWLNADFITAGRTGTAFDNYGGEDRFWLGPEAGQFGLWFADKERFDLAHWKTPPGFNEGAFEVADQSGTSVVMKRQLAVTNYSGTTFHCGVSRAAALIEADEVAAVLETPVPEGVRLVAFVSTNTLTNAGDEPWTARGGMLSIWILGQFKPLPGGRVVVPFIPGGASVLGPKATTDYFGKIPPERCRVAEDHLLFTCDGRHRSKIGISPARARDVVGSWDGEAGVLTLVKFNLPEDAADRPYVNSLWELQGEPFAGDVVNSYNDGPPAPGSPPMGPFYEIETSSPAAALRPGESITHVHRTFHFAGERAALDALAKAVLGVGLDVVEA